MDKWQPYLKEIEKAFDMQGLSFTEDGVCTLLIEDEKEVFLCKNPTLNSLDIVAPLKGNWMPSFPRHSHEFIWEMAYSPMVGIGPVLGRDKESGQLLLQLNLPLPCLTKNPLPQYLQSFITCLFDVEGQLSLGRDGDMPPPDSGLLRV